jgi:hypothetical protein
MVQAVVEGLRLPGPHRKAGLPASNPAFGGHDFARFRLGSHRPGAEVLGPLHLSTTQIYAETSLRALGDNYVSSVGGSR